MALKRILIVALALGVASGTGCKEKSNTTIQKQAPPGTGDMATAAPVNPNQPNPTGAQWGSAMGPGKGGATNGTGSGSAALGSAASATGEWAAPDDAGTDAK